MPKPTATVRSTRSRRYRVRRREQLEALGSPMRLQLVDTVAAVGPCSVNEMARHLGAKRESLYFHVARLEEVGLLHAVGERPTARRAEVLYDTPGRAIEVRHRPGDEDSARAHVRIGSANLRLTLRDLPRAFRSRARVRGPRRELFVGRVKGWLDAEELERANELIGELIALFRNGRRERGRRLFSLTAALLPEQPEEAP